MFMPRIPMDVKEINEGRRVRIPDNIIAKMSQGLVLSERQREIVQKHGKSYVESHKRDGRWVKPHLRDLSKTNKRSLFVDYNSEQNSDDDSEPTLWSDSKAVHINVGDEVWFSKLDRGSGGKMRVDGVTDYGGLILSKRNTFGRKTEPAMIIAPAYKDKYQGYITIL